MLLALGVTARGEPNIPALFSAVNNQQPPVPCSILEHHLPQTQGATRTQALAVNATVVVRIAVATGYSSK